MSKLILVRHGETDWNVEDRIQGWLDIPLNEEGRRQAERLARELAGMKIAAIYSSPLRRAFQTAEIIAEKHHLKVKKVSALKEINQGEWQGLLVSEAKQRYKNLYQKWLTHPLEVVPPGPGGESIEQVYRRGVKACRRITTRQKNSTICIVAHKGINALIKCYYLGLDLKNPWQLLPENAIWESIDV
ncbi:histidine phosphatase family protein [bacterium]|nr:histidine phosphatase family protein [bacterium]